MSILRCCAIALAAPFAAAALAAGEGALKPLTFADLPPIQEPTVVLLDWSGDSKSLYAAERERAAPTTRVVKIDVATGKRSTVGEYAGQGFSLSPRKDLLVHFDAGDWKLVDLASGNAEALFKSPGFQFLPVAPMWSRDGRYVAMLELVQPEGMARLDPWTIEAKGGVRVIDAGAAADQLMRKLSASSITVVDVRSRKVAWKLTGFIRILDVSWGADDRLYYGAVDDGDLASPHSAVTEVTISTQKTRAVYQVEGMIQPLRTAVSPDGKTLATAFNFAHPATDNFKSLVLIDLATLEKRRITGARRVTSPYLWTGDGKSIVYGERADGLTHLSRVFLDWPIWVGHINSPLEWHAWTELGYVVLVPEMRSSGECGEAAAGNDYIRDAGGLEGDIQDISAATDWILSQSYIDATRAALYGL